VECFADFAKWVAAFLGFEAALFDAFCLDAHALLPVAAAFENPTRDFEPFEILQALVFRTAFRTLFFERLQAASLGRLLLAL
jgi:hypothetical protein